jgi:CBS domain-containing protein
MEKVTVILDRKQSHFRHIASSSSVHAALCRMSCEGTDHLAVMDEDSRFIGVITEHDIATSVLVDELPMTKTLVSRLVNRQLPIATTEDTVEQCLQRMRQYNVKLLPVFEGFQFKGIVTAEDILQEAADCRMRIFDEDRSMVAY